LRGLDLSGCVLVAADLEDALAGDASRRLRKVFVPSADLGPQGLRTLVDACPYLQDLDVRDNNLLDDAALCHALRAYAGTLRSLNVHSTMITDVTGA
jgi:hypothetical protein